MNKPEIVEFKERKTDLTVSPSYGEKVIIKPFTAVFAASHFYVDKWIISETKYGIKIAEGATRKEAIKNASEFLKHNFYANDIHPTPQASFDAALKFRMKRAVKESLENKYKPLLMQVYGDSIRFLFHPLFGFDVIRFAEKYYPSHATNNESLKDMITADKGVKVALIIKAIL